MAIFSRNPVNWRDRQDSNYDHRETIYCEAPRAECSVNRIPVKVTNSWLNIWAWVDPITPYEHQIARNGGYYQMRDNQQRGMLI